MKGQTTNTVQKEAEGSMFSKILGAGASNCGVNERQSYGYDG